MQLPESKLRALLGDELDLAAVNAADLCVASGAVADLEALEARLRADDLESRRVPINVAAHSRLLDPHLDAFRACVQKIRLSSPRIPFVSTLTGQPASGDELTAPEYWVRHLRQTVRFGDGLSAVLEEPDCDAGRSRARAGTFGSGAAGARQPQAGLDRRLVPQGRRAGYRSRLRAQRCRTTLDERSRSRLGSRSRSRRRPQDLAADLPVRAAAPLDRTRYDAGDR